ncbi:LysR substrate-binding domain-containing protein [Enterovibrio norvegicus]|uniref:LysR substrate-binding domain-containing protein n=1 Tax=Enterovibrio norvegicus TaxID=188144 RepID=UPI0035507645
MNLESKWLEDFLALAETRNFSAAAVRRNVTQPAFSRRIRMLERSVGAELVDRGQTPIALTESGRVFRVTARTLMNQIAESVGQISALNNSDGRIVRLASAHSLALNLTLAIQTELSTQVEMPMLSVEAMNVDEAVEALKEGECDILFAFDNEHMKLPPFEHIPVGVAELLPVCSKHEDGTPRFSLTRKTVLMNDDEALPTPWLAYSPTSYMGRQTESVRHEVNIEPVFLSSMVDMLKAQALLGNGVAWLPDFSVQKELEEGALVVIGEPYLIRDVAYFAYRYQARLHPSGEKVWKALKSLSNAET